MNGGKTTIIAIICNWQNPSWKSINSMGMTTMYKQGVGMRYHKNGVETGASTIP